MNAQPAITREELDDGFAQLRDEIVALKKAVASIAARREAETPDFRAGDVVHKDEFRLFKWASGLALAAILGGLGFFYQGFADLRVTVERQHGELRSYMDRRFGEMDRQFAEMRGEMDRRFAEVELRDGPAVRRDGAATHRGGAAAHRHTRTPRASGDPGGR